MNHCDREHAIGRCAIPFSIGAALLLLLASVAYLWAVRGNAILLDLTFTGCF